MSNFAERLVARSTGRALDARVSLLTPRPTARFEQSGGLGAPGEGPLQNLDIPPLDSADALPDVGAPRAGTEFHDVIASAERADRRGSVSPSTSTPDEALGRPLHQSHPSSNAGRDDRDAYPHAASAGETTIVTSAPVANRGTSGFRHQRDSGNLGQNLEHEMTRPGSSAVARIEPAIGPTGRDMVPETRLMAAEERSEPAISIGKIEVHFLPKEAPLGAPKAQSQRTHGFHAYARARRGQR
jgi:hypothetical protein